MREHHIGLFEKGDDHVNTLVADVDLEFPLEADLDGDPDQDDEVRLRAVGGHYIASLHAQDDAVELHPEKPLLIYRFLDVPKGVYTLEVKVGSRWTALVHEVEVRKDGVYVEGDRHDTSMDDIHVGPAIDPTEDAYDEHAAEEEDYRDQPEEASS